jgi:hypothetical protein
MFSAAPAADDNDVVTTVRSDTWWTVSTQVPCLSCRQVASVTGLIFPADAVIDRRDRSGPNAAPASGAAKHVQLIYVERLSAPAVDDIGQLYEDHDIRVGGRYLMNHCDCCRAKFSDLKLFAPPEGLFNHPTPARGRQFAVRRQVGPIVATGCVVPVADYVATAVAATDERVLLPV